MSRVCRSLFVSLVLSLPSIPLLSQTIPLKNWTVPALDAGLFQGSGPLSPLTHNQGNSPAVFVPFGPCRLFDSRVSLGGPGPVGGTGSPGERTHDFVPSGCLSAGFDVSQPILAWSINVTVVNPRGPGFVYFYPAGGVPPPVATVNYAGSPGELRNNAAIVLVNAATGAFVIGAGVNGTDYVLDTNGVFLSTLEPNTSFKVTSTTVAPAIIGENTSTLDDAVAVQGVITSTQGFNQAAIRGINKSLNDTGIGVEGTHEGSGIGV